MCYWYGNRAHILYGCYNILHSIYETLLIIDMVIIHVKTDKTLKHNFE